MSKTNLVDSVAAFIERFVFIKDKQVYRLLALWVIQTHLYKEFEYTGYIFAHSPEPGSGKSRLLEILDLLVANSSGLLYKPTDAVLFRTADEMTQLLDEVDSWMNAEHLRAILNAGFHRGAKVLRNEQQNKGKWKPIPFPVYGPRALAGIGLGILHGTTKDRTFIIPMVKQTLAERREKFRSRKVKPEADQLREDIGAWVSQNRSLIVAEYDDAETALPYIAHLHDRTIDIVEPLAAILEVLHSGAPQVNDRRIELLEAVNLTRDDGEEFLTDHRILRELARLTTSQDRLVGSASELAAKCGLSPAPTEYEMGETLRRYGFESRSIRIGESVRYRYELTQPQLADVCSRFGPVGPNGENRGKAEPCAANEELVSLAGFYEQPS